MKRWTSINTVNEDARWHALSERLKALGVANQYVPWAGDLDTLSGFEVLDGFHHARISSRLGPQLLKSLKVQSSWITTLSVIDGAMQTPHGWWPMCGLFESFGQVLVERGPDMDTRGNVFVAGAGSAARVAIAAFFKAGFRKFLITNFREDEAQNLMTDMRQKFFGISLEWISMERIVLLPGETSVLVNCTPAVEENQLLTELSYLNFLKRPGFLFELSRSKDTILVQEARDANVEVVQGQDLALRTDVLWSKWAFGVDLDLKTYQF